ncbi:MAG TPA: DNA mismatch repair endonuclease MutL, partial [Phycisphaerales bacterium]|nr:DNA mismatch repair endonuclease MutL [Phycisphaerales bacterium]
MAIRRLPALLVNQIAAGEVIERPASVVKECVENALDAGAKQVAVEIEQGGKELIRIADDGGGIAIEELGLAIAPHATSKLEKAEDLEAIGTLGFRGEALASIASVSRLSLVSRKASSESGGMIECEGDVVKDVKPAARPVGTTVTVRNLFFNTPARRKFLKTDETEAGRIREVIENLAIAHPATAFSYSNDGRKSLDLEPARDAEQRVLDVIG